MTDLEQRLRALENEVDALRAQLGPAREDDGDTPEAEIVTPGRP